MQKFVSISKFKENTTEEKARVNGVGNIWSDTSNSQHQKNN